MFEFNFLSDRQETLASIYAPSMEEAISEFVKTWYSRLTPSLFPFFTNIAMHQKMKFKDGSYCIKVYSLKIKNP